MFASLSHDELRPHESPPKILMKLAIIGDGLLAHLILFKLSQHQFRDPIFWFRGLTPTLPPVSLLHRHVGRTFVNDQDQEAAWLSANSLFEDLLCSLEPELSSKIVQRITMLRPTTAESRLSQSFKKYSFEHIDLLAQNEFSQFPFLAPCDNLFRYDDAYVINSRELLSYMKQCISKLSIHTTHALQNMTSQTNGLKLRHWQLTNAQGNSYNCSHVVFTNGYDITRWFDGIELQRRPGELVVIPRPEDFPCHIAVSRNGHVAPTLCGRFLCAGATYLHPNYECKNPAYSTGVERRSVEVASRECLSGIQRSVPSLNLKNPLVWFGTRAVLHPDRRPIMGEACEGNVYVATGLASKGMLWGPLVADALTRLLLNQEILHYQTMDVQRLKKVQPRFL